MSNAASYLLHFKVKDGGDTTNNLIVHPLASHTSKSIVFVAHHLMCALSTFRCKRHGFLRPSFSILPASPSQIDVALCAQSHCQLWTLALIGYHNKSCTIDIVSHVQSKLSAAFYCRLSELSPIRLQCQRCGCWLRPWWTSRWCMQCIVGQALMKKSTWCLPGLSLLHRT